MIITVGYIQNLPDYETYIFRKLVNIYNKHIHKNSEKNKYYEGKVRLSDVNLGIALPRNFGGLEIGCNWGAKAVDVLAGRSMFDGFVGSSGEPSDIVSGIVEKNGFISEYDKAVRDELLYGVTFATLSSDGQNGAKIRFHSPETAAAIWDGERGDISAGLAIIDSKKVAGNEQPTIINLYLDDAIWVLMRDDYGYWSAEYHPHKMGQPLMVPMIWNPTAKKPLGQSRLKEPVRDLIDSYVRTVANATIGLEFSTAPQKYILGVTDEQYDALINKKFQQYIGNIIAATYNPETGEKPSFGQLTQGSITPHVEMMRIISAQFSAATGLSVSDTGIVNESNPTSAEALTAQSTSLIRMAEQLNSANGETLKKIMLMAEAIAANTTLDQLSDEQKDIIAHFKNPAMPSVAATADAAIKIATARQGFAETDVFLEMIGFDQADIRRIKAQESRARGMQILEDLGNEQS